MQSYAPAVHRLAVPTMSSPSPFAADASSAKTPVFVLTGFLGSGKTTLLNRLLRDPALSDSAVIVNELGDVALDHLLVERVEGEVAVLRSGCVCCALRSDFESTLRELLAKRDEGSLPAFARVVVETTGLADPAPLVHTVDANPLISHFCHLGAVLTTVDAVNAPRQLAEQWEARKQVALADRLLITKTDLATASTELQVLLAELNPHAALQSIDAHTAMTELLAPVAVHAAPAAAMGLLAGRPISRLHGEVESLVLEAETPLDWARLQQWLAELRAKDGARLLRLKGVVRLAEEQDPLLLHGVHHLFHPPLRAPSIAWPAAHSTVVLILRNIRPPEAGAMRAAFAACVA